MNPKEKTRGAAPVPGAGSPEPGGGNGILPGTIRTLLSALGEDPAREGLSRTPERVAEAWQFLLQGYRTDPAKILENAIFSEDNDEMICVRDIELYSMCEHHLLPFFGKAHVAYIPDGQIMGLSKAARLVEMFSRRFQVQERLTEQIAQAVWDTLHPMGVGVVVEAYHLCMMMRGVEKQNSKTITSAMRGTFLRDQKTRDEFLRLSMAGHVLLS
jgi:GTP cyclohydrolase I